MMTAPTTIIVVALAGLFALLVAMWSRPVARRRVEAQPMPRGRARSGLQLIDAIERTSRDTRSGMALRPALLNGLRLHPTLLPTLRDELDRGAPMQRALADVQPVPRGDMAFVLHGLRLAADNGGAVADTLDRVVAVVRERHVWRGERHAQAAQARLSARMLTVLPMAEALVGFVSGPRVRQAYLQSSAVGVATAVGIALNLTGWWWMRRLVRGPDGA